MFLATLGPRVFVITCTPCPYTGNDSGSIQIFLALSERVIIAVKNGKNILLMSQLLKNIFKFSLHKYIFTLAPILVMKRYILFIVPVVLA
jgi:hypothetical protein